MSVFIQQMNVVTMFWHKRQSLSDDLVGSLFLFFISGRVRYKFASFWNRNHAVRSLQRAVKNFREMLEAEKKVTALAYSICVLICIR